MRADSAVRWLWSATSVPARWARASMVPAAAAYAACTRLRSRVYQRGVLRSYGVTVPTGKTPFASWIAAQCAAHGVTPGIVLSSYGPDEAAVHRERVPGAVVVQGRDRPRAARRAVQLGAGAVVLDDAFQRLDLRRDVDVLLVSAESAESAPWTLPAGPWREPLRAARRADIVVVTRKRASASQACEMADRLTSLGVPDTHIALAHLELGDLTELGSERVVDRSSLRGARVLAVCAIADPASFAHQLTALGAQVQMAVQRDHHVYTEAEAAGLLSTARDVDYVVVTHKDAVKLRRLWPESAPRTLVAHLALEWDQGLELVRDRISDLLTSYYAPGMY